jgi:hypothetical protein
MTIGEPKYAMNEFLDVEIFSYLFSWDTTKIFLRNNFKMIHVLKKRTY